MEGEGGRWGEGEEGERWRGRRGGRGFSHCTWSVMIAVSSFERTDSEKKGVFTTYKAQKVILKLPRVAGAMTLYATELTVLNV